MTTQEIKLKRVQCNYQADSARFLLECDFSKQYNNYYKKRLEKTKPFLQINCKSKWNPTIPIYGLAKLAAVVDGHNQQLDELDSFEMSDFDDLPKSPHQPTVSNYSLEIKPEPGFNLPKRMRHYSGNENDPKTSTQHNPKQSPVISIGYPLTPTESPIMKLNQNDSRGGINDNDCIVIGIIFKRMKLQPDVISELTKGDFSVKIERYLGHYTSQDDQLILEDDDESISLVGNINPKRFVTGVVVAVLGNAIDDGSRFSVKDICYAERNYNLHLEDENDHLFSSRHLDPSIDQSLSNKQPIYLMVVSGLGFHQDMKKRSLLTRALQDMIDFIWGGSKFEEDDRSSRVARILVAGDSLLESRLIPDEESSSQKLEDIAIRMKRSRQVKPYSGSIQAVRHMDGFFAQLSKTINVDVMPGPSDPSSHLMPQQPFHPCMFPKSCMFSTFNCITNPHHAFYNDNVEVFATSGQNIDIISRFSGISDPIEIMKCHLMWANCAPNAPDNLYSCPHEDEDPFVIDFIPEIYISGCQDNFRTDYYCYNIDNEELSRPSIEFDELLEGEFVTEAEEQQPIVNSTSRQINHPEKQLKINNTSSRYRNPLIDPKKSCTLLVTVPKFYETFSCVLINLLNLESQLLSFK